MEASTLTPESITLLMVDDDPMMTDLLRQSMTKRGFPVLTAGSGAQALEIVSGDAKIDLVIMDVSMPNMDGFETARRLGAIAPDLPVLLATGHDSEGVLDAAPPNVVGVVQKPYQAKYLAERILEIMEARRSLNTDQG